MYIHGGRDLGAGQLDNMWRLDLDSLMRATEDGHYPVHWEQIVYRGKVFPGKISHHKCAVMGDRMVLVGGMKNGDQSNNEVWLFDLKTNTWELGKSSVSHIF